MEENLTGTGSWKIMLGSGLEWAANILQISYSLTISSYTSGTINYTGKALILDGPC